MIFVANYSEQYYDDCVLLIENFHREFLKRFDPDITKQGIECEISNFRGDNCKNAFLLIINNRCEGAISGIELKPALNPKRIFQENFFYVNEPFGRYGIWLIHQVEKMLKAYGVDIIVMAVLESEKSDRIKKIYGTMNYKKLEEHYMKVL